MLGYLFFNLLVIVFLVAIISREARKDGLKSQARQNQRDGPFDPEDAGRGGCCGLGLREGGEMVPQWRADSFSVVVQNVYLGVLTNWRKF